MSKICILNCVDDTARIPVRASYINLYKWPESDSEFVKSAAEGGRTPLQSRVAESISCRQTYLRSYTFSRKETMPVKAMKCFVKVREKVVAGRKENGKLRRRRWRRNLRRWCDVFWQVLFCGAVVGVIDRGV